MLDIFDRAVFDSLYPKSTLVFEAYPFGYRSTGIPECDHNTYQLEPHSIKMLFLV